MAYLPCWVKAVCSPAFTSEGTSDGRFRHTISVWLKRVNFLMLDSAASDGQQGYLSAGKTTLLRDVVRLLANDFDKRVIVVDTSNEIGGDGAVPHACLGRARRMSPADRERQHETLLEAVQNHTPEVPALL